MNMEYHLGKFLKERYIETKFINQSYLHNEEKVDVSMNKSDDNSSSIHEVKNSKIPLKKRRSWLAKHPEVLKRIPNKHESKNIVSFVFEY